MAKKKKKKRVYDGLDTHHILWQKRYWNSGNLKVLRMHPYCRLKIPAGTLHREIHGEINTIPLPSQRNAKEVLTHLNYLVEYGAITENDSFEKRLRVLIALFECVEQPTADALKKQLKIVCRFYNKPP